MEIERRIRWYQRPLNEYLLNGGKRAIEIAHRRWGKDEIALGVTCEMAHRRVASYWHCLPEYAQARKALWTAVNPHTGKRRIDEAFPEALRETTNEQEMFIRFKNGSTWQLIGSDRYNSLVGAGIAGVVFSEWALADPASWGYIRPMIEENSGWALFITTPRGRNHAYDMYEMAKKRSDWFAEKSTVDDTGALNKEQLESALEEYKALFGEDEGTAQFEQEYRCSFDAAIMGAFYAGSLRRAREEGRIGRIPIDRGVRVWTAWDLGVSDSTAIWFGQTVGREERLIDYYEASGVGLDHYAEVLRERGYQYERHYFPHDIAHRELSSGLSRLDTLRTLGITADVVPLHSVMDGINATRRFLDRCWIDEERCKRGLEAITQYRRDYDDKLKIFKPAPLHDWTSHASDALRMRAAIAQARMPEGLKRDRYAGKAKASSSWLTA